MYVQRDGTVLPAFSRAKSAGRCAFPLSVALLILVLVSRVLAGTAGVTAPTPESLSRGAASFNQGVLHKERGEYDAAIDDFNRALAADPANAEAFNERGFVYFLKGSPPGPRPTTGELLLLTRTSSLLS